MKIGFFRRHLVAFSMIAAVGLSGSVGRATPNAAAATLSGLTATAIATTPHSNVVAAVTITAPANGSTVSGIVTIISQVGSNVTWINLYIDGKYFTSSPPYTVLWDSTSVSNGSHKISAKAFSSSDRLLGTSAVTVTVSNGSSPSPTPTPTPTSTPTASPTPTPTSTPTSAPTPGISGTAYYVDSVAGSDSNSGTSPSSAWKSIGHVQSMLSSLGPGDGVLFKTGDVWNEELDLSGGVAGTSANRIIFSSYGGGAKPIIDGGARRSFCVGAIGGSVKYVTIDGFECRFTVSQGVTFQTSGGGMPGIIVQNMYIHNTGPGAYRTNGPVVGSDPGGYQNQLDFEDFGQGADGVQFLNNVVKWCGGHNCLEVHHDTGAVVVQGNVVGPGCVHGCIDTKGVGTPSAPATIASNTATCGASQNLCGQPPSSGNPSPAFYYENPYTPNAAVNYSLNLAYDSGVGFQVMGGGCASGHSPCSNSVKMYNNTVYVPANAFAMYSDGGGVTTIDVRNNILDGGTTSMANVSMSAEDYNDVGGSQGSSGFSVNGSGPSGSSDEVNTNPMYVNSGSAPPDMHLQTGSPLIGAGQKGLTSNSNIGAY